ncbi:MAG: NAD(P)/FAD-dependent oxidoreductase [bacterium]
MGKTILILGGGVGGLVTANKLRHMLSKKHRIVLLDRNTKHTFPSNLWVMVGWREPLQIQKELSLLNKKGIEYIHAEVSNINLSTKVIKTNSGDFTYDYLVIALGAELAPEMMTGFSETAYNLYDLDGAIRLRHVLSKFSGGTIIIAVSALPFKCPAAPYEAGLLLDYLFRKKGIREKIELKIFTPEAAPMGVAGPVLSNMVRQMVEGHGIIYNPNFKLSSINSKDSELNFENGQKVKFDLLIGVPPHRSPAVVKEAGLTNESGWIPVDKGTLKTGYDDVYALGDVATIKLPVGKMLPKAGVFAHYQAEVVAHNIANEIKRERAEKEFNGKGYCFLEIGEGKAGFASGNFYTSPAPEVKMRKPSRFWHWGKVIFEKWWLWHWF